MKRARRSGGEGAVVFRVRRPEGASFVDLRGEMTHFQHVCPMDDAGHGLLEKTVRLGTGVFAYKYFAGGDRWFLDPENPRTRSRDGARNNVLVIGGAEEPVLHAPARPWVFATDDGRLCVRAGLRRGHGERLFLRWDEGDGPRVVAMVPVADEDEHRLFEALLPASARAVEYLFGVGGPAESSGGVSEGRARVDPATRPSGAHDAAHHAGANDAPDLDPRSAGHAPPDLRWIGRSGGAGQALRIEPADVTPETPSWWRDAVVYTIVLDRFRRGDGPRWGAPPPSTMDRWGGDLDGVTAALPYLQDLGVTVLHLTPVVVAPSSHRYDAVDPRAVDPALGGEAALVRLFEAAHARGMKVILDVAATHVDRDFFAFRDVRDRGPRSPYYRWFHIHRYPFSEGLDFRVGTPGFGHANAEHRDPGYEHYQKGQWREPLLHTEEPEVVEYLADTFARWVKLGADGFRVDAAADLPLPTIRSLADAARSAGAARSDAARSADSAPIEGASRSRGETGGGIVLFGEVIPPNTHRYTADALDAATDFPVQEALYDWLSRRRIGASEMARRCARRRFDRGGPGFTALHFTATHDQHRFRSFTVDPRPARLAQLFVLTGAAVPMMLYGDEVGLTGGPATSREFEGVWPDRMPMPWPVDGDSPPPEWDLQTLDLVKGALRLRRDTPALRRGDEACFAHSAGADDVLVVRRTWGDDTIDIVLHGGDGTVTLPLPEGAPSHGEALLTLGDASLIPESPSPARPIDDVSTGETPLQASHDVATGETPLHASHDVATALRLGPWAGAVIRRVAAPESMAVWRELCSGGALLSSLSFREGAVESAPLPVHLYVTVTERCNLACLHCITAAPEKTTSGRARTAAPWLVEALREPFAAADYVGFVHGGESLVAPIFWDLLRAIQDAHAHRRLPLSRGPVDPRGPAEGDSRPARPDVHVLSNGMLLDKRRVHRLIEHGVTSLSVSIDGAAEVTNDSLRKGGRLPTILANLRRAAEIRRATRADLRIGVSTVVTAGNVGELADLGRIVADLGLDWLKVEELYPCTPAARHQMILGREPRVEEAMNDLRRALARTGVVIVDHRDPPSGCACEALSNPLLAEFRAADDFANRTVFHPCRMEWEQACIDPDGAVHPVDYGRPAIGDLQTASLLDLWNGPEMRSLRRAALARTPRRLRTSCAR